MGRGNQLCDALELGVGLRVACSALFVVRLGCRSALVAGEEGGDELFVEGEVWTRGLEGWDHVEAVGVLHAGLTTAGWRCLHAALRGAMESEHLYVDIVVRDWDWRVV
jgi:hypothetical protein